MNGQGDDSGNSATDDQQIDDPAIHTQYVQAYGRALLATKNAGEPFTWPQGSYLVTATTLAISDALARRKLKTPKELVRALRTALEIGGVSYADLDRSVGHLDLSIRSLNSLQKMNIRFIGELVRMGATEARKAFGSRSAKELGEALAQLNLGFGSSVESWFPPSPPDGESEAEK